MNSEVVVSGEYAGRKQLQIIIKYIYTRKLDFIEEELLNTLVATNYFLIRYPENGCSVLIYVIINEDNVQDIPAFAKTLSNDYILEGCEKVEEKVYGDK